MHKNKEHINLLWRNCSHLGRNLNQNLDYKLKVYSAPGDWCVLSVISPHHSALPVDLGDSGARNNGSSIYMEIKFGVVGMPTLLLSKWTVWDTASVVEVRASLSRRRVATRV